MKNLLIIFFTVWFGLGAFIIWRWYRRKHSQASNGDGGGGFDGDGGSGDGGDGGGDGGD